MIGNNWFKAKTNEERSGDILVSFASRWKAPLVDKGVEFIFRRRFPTSFSPCRMFFYIGAPYSELIGYSFIKKVTRINLSEALELVDGACITRDELEKYFQGYGEIGCYQVYDITLFKAPISLADLRGETGFSPPQSFVSLSMQAMRWLDEKPIYKPKGYHHH